jgi:hypothetical protein
VCRGANRGQRRKQTGPGEEEQTSAVGRGANRDQIRRTNIRCEERNQIRNQTLKRNRCKHQT